MATTDEAAAPSAGSAERDTGRVVRARARRRHGAPQRLGRERSVGRRGRIAARRRRAQQVRRGRGRAALARVRAPVPRPDADRAADRGNREPLPPEGTGNRPRPALPDALQRGARPAPGGQGGGGGRGAAEDDDHQGARPARRRARADSGRRARPGRHRVDRGRRPRAGGRAAAVGGHARGRGGGADRRELAGLEGRGERRDARHSARRPDGHGLHEHERDARLGQLRRHVDGDGDRGRPYLAHAPERGRCRTRR